MSKYSGLEFAVFIVDGYDLLPSLMENASMADEILTQPTTPFGVDSEQNTPIGLKRGTLVAGGGLYDATADALHTAIGTVVGISRIICAAISGNSIGKIFMGFGGAYSQKYEVQDQRDGLTKANVTYLVSGDVDTGLVVQHHTTKSVDWDTKSTPVDEMDSPQAKSIDIVSSSVANPSVITTATPHGLVSGDVIAISGHTGSTPSINDDGEGYTVTVTDSTHFTIPVNVTVGGTGGILRRVSWASGGVGYQQVTALSGFSGYLGKIVHSPDAVTWADLISFANVTSAHAKERKATATPTTVVDRYVAHVGDVTGTGSIKVFSGFIRG